MIWLTWRQHRKQVQYLALALAVIAAVMIPTGLAMHDTFTRSGLEACLNALGTAQVIPADSNICNDLSEQFGNQYNSMAFIGILFVLLPVFLGIFIGAPLVAREIEHGTHRLVWTQGVSRRHWALVKFGLLGGATLVLAAAYALGMTWWFTPLVRNGGGRLGLVSFDVQGVVPIAYTLFAVAMGVFCGSAFKRVLPAMGVTLGGFAVVRILVEWLARPSYMSPVAVSLPLYSTQEFNPESGAWVYSQGVLNGAGRLVMPGGRMTCDGPRSAAKSAASVSQCGNDLAQGSLGPGPFKNWMQYQPGDRFWDFQGIECGIFLALTAILLYLAVRRIRAIS